MKRILIIALAALGFANMKAQDKEPSPFTFSGYIDTYYSYDFGNPDNHTRPSFFYSYNRNNEVNLNLGLIKVNYTKGNIRGNFGLMAGTYAQYNLIHEQELLRNVYEANVGVKISSKNNIWIDAGIMPAHIGFESALGKDCYALTRSILAENSPYYEAGVKVGYTSASEKWYLAGMYLNGWQRIQRVEGNQTPAFGTQATYKANSNTTFNWSTYIGNEQPDSDRKWRYFNDFYALFKLTDKVNIHSGFDIGAQQKSKGSSNYSVWYAPIIIAQYMVSSKIHLAARGEYYNDKNGVIIATATPNGFQTFGYSANFDYLPADNVMFRIEARSLNSKDEVFLKNNNPTTNNFFMTTSLAISF